MPLVQIGIWAGQSQEVKNRLAGRVTQALTEEIGCPKEAVTILFDEVPKQDWFIGGQACTELFKTPT